jgi:hypothetical protein
MARAMRRLEYRGKKMEYIKRDALAHILAKMSRWGLTVKDVERAVERMKGDK